MQTRPVSWRDKPGLCNISRVVKKRVRFVNFFLQPDAHFHEWDTLFQNPAYIETARPISPWGRTCLHRPSLLLSTRGDTARTSWSHHSISGLRVCGDHIFFSSVCSYHFLKGNKLEITIFSIFMHSSLYLNQMLFALWETQNWWSLNRIWSTISCWRHQMETFSVSLSLGEGNQLLVYSPLKGQWRGALICVWINNWASNGAADNLRRHCAHHDVALM